MSWTRRLARLRRAWRAEDLPATPHGAQTPTPEARRDVRGSGGVYNPLSGLGMYGVDSGASALPAPSVRLDRADQDTLYEDSGYARRIVDEIVDHALRSGWSVVTRGDDTALSDVLAAEDKRLGLKAAIADAAKAGRRYGSAYLLMTFDEQPNATDGERAIVDLARPPRQVRRVCSLVQLDPDECTPIEWDDDPRSPTYQQPSVYQVTTSTTGTQLVGVLVHTSRLLEFVGHRLSARRRRDNHDRHLSVLQPAWPQIANLTQGDSALATHMQDASLGVLKVSGKAALDMGDQRELVQLYCEDLAASRSRVGVLVLDENEEYLTVGHSVAGLDAQHDRLAEGLSAVTGMPQTLLHGQAPAGLNSDGDSQAGNWRDQVGSYRDDDIAPQLERYYGYQMQALGAPSTEWALAWGPLNEPSEADRAAVYQVQSGADVAYMNAGVLTAEEVRAARFAAKPGPIVVQPTPPADEPEPASDLGAPVSGGAASVQDTALNGAQITSLIAIVAAVHRREIPRESGVEIVMRSLLVERDVAERLVGELPTAPAPGVMTPSTVEAP